MAQDYGNVCGAGASGPIPGNQSDLPPTEEEFNLIDSLPSEVQGRILEFLSYENIIQLKSLSKSWKSLIESDEFIHAVSLRKQPLLTLCYFFIEKGVWQWAGFDPNRRSGNTLLGKWRRLPPLSFLPTICNPDADLFKPFLFCSKDGLACMNFSRSPHEEWLIVFNPLTQHWKELPPLFHRRNPVLMHMLVDQATHSYQILVAGSSGSGDERLTKITDLYDSRTGKWERKGDVPCSGFPLNEYQNSCYLNGNIFTTGIDRETMVILGYNVEKGSWTSIETCPSLLSSAILQLVENSGEVYLFSERENGRSIEHCVYKLERTDKDEETTWNLRNVIKKSRVGGRSLQVYPESALVPFRPQQLCIYNIVDHTGEVYDIEDREKCEAPPTLPRTVWFPDEPGFFTLNRVLLAIQPRFSSKV